MYVRVRPCDAGAGGRGVRHAGGVSVRTNPYAASTRRFEAGLFGAVAPRLAPHPGALAARPAGKRPGAFPRTPFAASVRKIYLMGALFK